MAYRIVFIVGTIVFGAFAGAFVWAFFFLMDAGIHLLWDAAPAALAQAGLPAVAYPIAFCTLGGVVIGLFTKHFGDYPQDMNTVMAQVKERGRYEYDHVGASFFGALLPLLFGGSIGPEAGLTGVIAGLCTWVRDRLRFMGAEMRQLAEAGTAAVVSALFSTPLFGMVVPLVGTADDSEGRPANDITPHVPRARKWAVYVLAVAGALAAMEVLGHAFGAAGGLPHFSDINIGRAELAWGIPLALAGAAAGWLYFPFGALFRAIAKRLEGKVVLKPTIAGFVLGWAGVALPFVLFAGEAQTDQLAQSWTTFAAPILIATGCVKVLATQLCLNLGWRGGHFFPLIFAGISLGYGLAVLTGIDAVFALCAVAGALMGVVMRQPILTALLLFLVFPVKGGLVLLVAAVIGSALPVPKGWLGR